MASLRGATCRTRGRRGNLPRARATPPRRRFGSVGLEPRPPRVVIVARRRRASAAGREGEQQRRANVRSPPPVEALSRAALVVVEERGLMGRSCLCHAVRALGAVIRDTDPNRGRAARSAEVRGGHMHVRACGCRMLSRVECALRQVPCALRGEEQSARTQAGWGRGGGQPRTPIFSPSRGQCF